MMVRQQVSEESLERYVKFTLVSRYLLKLMNAVFQSHYGRPRAWQYGLTFPTNLFEWTRFG